MVFVDGGKDVTFVAKKFHRLPVQRTKRNMNCGTKLNLEEMQLSILAMFTKVVTFGE